MQLTIWQEAPVDEVVDVLSLETLSGIFQTEHYDFHFKPDSYAGQHIGKIAEYQEKCYRRIEETLQIPFRRRIRYFLTDSPDEVGRIMEELFGEYEPGNGDAIAPNNVIAVYSEEINCIGIHEDAHLFSYAYCDPTCALLSEGIAQFLDEWWGKPNTEWVKMFVADGRYRSVCELADDETFWNVSSEITYPIAGAFTAFLVERIGVAAYLERIYKPALPLAEKIEAVFHSSPEALEQEFLLWIETK